MKKIALLSVVFGILLIHFGCEKEPDVTKGTPKFTLTISPESGDEVVGEKVPITLRTAGGDSLTFMPDETTTVHSYSRPAGLTGVWEITDTLYVNSEGPNQAYVFAYQFIEGIDDPIVKEGRADIIGHFPELTVTANPVQTPWMTSSSITIVTAYGDSLVTDLPGVNGALNGTFLTPPLDSTTTYHFAFYSKWNNVTVRNITINVNAPTRADTLSNKYDPPSWTFNGLAFSPDGFIWDTITDLEEQYFDNTKEFLPEGQVKICYGQLRYDDDQDSVEPWNLSLDGEYLTIGDFTRRITKLTIDTLEYTYHFPGFNITRETWTR